MADIAPGPRFSSRWLEFARTPQAKATCLAALAALALGSRLLAIGQQGIFLDEAVS